MVYKMTTQTYYYKKTRGSVVDVICDELTFGEEVYIWSDSANKYVATKAPSLLISEYNVSTDWDDNGQNFILVQVGDEETQNKVIELAKKFSKEVLTRHTNYGDLDKRFQIKILIDEEDFDTVYFDPNVLIRGKKAA